MKTRKAKPKKNARTATSRRQTEGQGVRTLKNIAPTASDLAREVGLLDQRYKAAVSKRHAVEKEVAAFIKDQKARGREVEVTVTQWHQLSIELGGIFIYREIVKDHDPRGECNDPYDIFSYDELANRHGHKEAAEMAKACRDLGVANQRTVSITELKRCGFKSPRSAVVKALKLDGVALSHFKKY